MFELQKMYLVGYTETWIKVYAWDDLEYIKEDYKTIAHYEKSFYRLVNTKTGEILIRSNE